VDTLFLQVNREKIKMIEVEKTIKLIDQLKAVIEKLRQMKKEFDLERFDEDVEEEDKDEN
jgi:hypothetical protein